MFLCFFLCKAWELNHHCIWKMLYKKTCPALQMWGFVMLVGGSTGSWMLSSSHDELKRRRRRRRISKQPWPLSVDSWPPVDYRQRLYGIHQTRILYFINPTLSKEAASALCCQPPPLLGPWTKTLVCQWHFNQHAKHDVTILMEPKTNRSLLYTTA